MPLPYYKHLSRADKAIYNRSNRTREIDIMAGVAMDESLAGLRAALAEANPPAVQARSYRLCNQICSAIRARPVNVVVLHRRPSDDWGELQGLYEPAEADGSGTITVWMRTARREQVVAYRTFVRTLVHELCHHLDYVHLELEDSFHTEGFFSRESSIARQLFALEAAAGPRPNGPDAGSAGA